jgi:hypothetical protein
MKLNNIKTYILFTGILSQVIGLNAQTYIGLNHSNLGGIHQANLNPANIANSRHRLYFNGITAGFGFNNDYLKLNFPFPILNLITGKVPSSYTNSNGSLVFQDNWLKEDINGRAKNMNLYLQTKAPGFMMSLPHGFAFGFQYKNTINFQMNDVSEPLARLARYGIDSSKGGLSYSGPNQFQIGQTFGDNSFTVNVNAFGEFGVTLAKTIINTENLVLKFGVTPKLLLGYATGYIKNRGLLLKAAGTDTIVLGETDLEYGYTDISAFSKLQNINFGAINNKLQGSGFGYDIGAAFEYKNKALKNVSNKKNNYTFRGGISILDGGHIAYKNKIKNTRISNTGGDKAFIISPAFASAWSNGTDKGLKYTDSVMRTLLSVDTTAKTIQTNMPSTLNLQFDYNIFKFLYLGANLSQDLRGKNSIGMRKPSYIVIIPRFESRFLELALPIGMMNDYKNPRLGMYLRIGPAFIGSDNLIGQLKGKDIYGTDVYFGISFGITKKKNKSSSDKDSGCNQ